MILLIALAHAVPVVIAAFAADGDRTVLTVAVLSALAGLLTGNPAYMMTDILAVTLSYRACMWFRRLSGASEVPVTPSGFDISTAADETRAKLDAFARKTYSFSVDAEDKFAEAMNKRRAARRRVVCEAAGVTCGPPAASDNASASSAAPLEHDDVTPPSGDGTLDPLMRQALHGLDRMYSSPCAPDNTSPGSPQPLEPDAVPSASVDGAPDDTPFGPSHPPSVIFLGHVPDGPTGVDNASGSTARETSCPQPAGGGRVVARSWRDEVARTYSGFFAALSDTGARLSPGVRARFGKFLVDAGEALQRAAKADAALRLVEGRFEDAGVTFQERQASVHQRVNSVEVRRCFPQEQWPALYEQREQKATIVMRVGGEEQEEAGPLDVGPSLAATAPSTAPTIRQTDVIAVDTRDVASGGSGYCLVVETRDGDVSVEAAADAVELAGYAVVPSPPGLRHFCGEELAADRIGAHPGHAGLAIAVQGIFCDFCEDGSVECEECGHCGLCGEPVDQCRIADVPDLRTADGECLRSVLSSEDLLTSAGQCSVCAGGGFVRCSECGGTGVLSLPELAAWRPESRRRAQKVAGQYGVNTGHLMARFDARPDTSNTMNPVDETRLLHVEAQAM